MGRELGGLDYERDSQTELEKRLTSWTEKANERF